MSVNTAGKAELQKWQSQAPANTMILGEHSVVYGHPALACAVDQYVTITWQQRTDSAIHIYSALGEHHTQLEQISNHPKLNFAVSALQEFQAKIPFGLDIKIESEFSSTIGLGSSAAVLAAMLSGLNSICETGYSSLELFNMGHQIILKIQGRGSGTDLAASLKGGLVYYQPKNEQHPQPEIKNLPIRLPLVLIYSGYKTPTAEVLELVAENWADKPKQLEMLYRSMAKVTRTAYLGFAEEHNAASSEASSLASQDALQNFYQCSKEYQRLMQQLGVSDETLENIISALNGCSEIHAAKISGSGLGDCVLGIGKLEQCSTISQTRLDKYQRIAIHISETGTVTQQIN